MKILKEFTSLENVNNVVRNVRWLRASEYFYLSCVSRKTRQISLLSSKDDFLF